jgi:hypothetical protein
MGSKQKTVIVTGAQGHRKVLGRVRCTPIGANPKVRGRRLPYKRTKRVGRTYLPLRGRIGGHGNHPGRTSLVMQALNRQVAHYGHHVDLIVMLARHFARHPMEACLRINLWSSTEGWLRASKARDKVQTLRVLTK